MMLLFDIDKLNLVDKSQGIQDLQWHMLMVIDSYNRCMTSHILLILHDYRHVDENQQKDYLEM